QSDSRIIRRSEISSSGTALGHSQPSRERGEPMRKKSRKRATMLDQNENTLRLKADFSNHCPPPLWRSFTWLGHWCAVIAAALAIWCLASDAMAAETAKPAPEASKAAAPKEAPLVVWNQAITVFRASFAGLNAQERAAQAAERIEALPLGRESAEIKFEPAKIGAEEGIAFSVNSTPLFSLAAADLAPDANQTLNAEAQTVVTALRAALRVRVAQRQWSTLLMSAAHVLIATLVLLGLLWLWRQVKIWLLRTLQRTAALPEKHLRLFAVDLRLHLLQGGRAAIRLISAAVVLLLGYWWLVYCLEQFPYTAAVGERLERSLVQLFLDFGRGALAAIPGLIAVVIIILIALWCVRVI